MGRVVLPTAWVAACGEMRVLQEALIGCCDIYKLVLVCLVTGPAMMPREVISQSVGASRLDLMGVTVETGFQPPEKSAMFL